MELINLQTFDNYFTANIELTKLRAAGVECYLKDEYTVTIDPILSNAIGGIKLVVRKDDIKKVQKIIQQLSSTSPDDVLCPECGSNQFISIPKRSAENLLTAITTWLFSSYAISVENIYQCKKCGYKSETLPQNPAPYN